MYKTGQGRDGLNQNNMVGIIKCKNETISFWSGFFFFFFFLVYIYVYIFLIT